MHDVFLCCLILIFLPLESPSEQHNPANDTEKPQCEYSYIIVKYFVHRIFF